MQNVQQCSTSVFQPDRYGYLYDCILSYKCSCCIFFLPQAATPAGIAVIHSVFNVTATIILLPFAKGLEKLACLTIRDKKEDVVVSAEDREFMILEPVSWRNRHLQLSRAAMQQKKWQKNPTMHCLQH